MMKDPTGGGRFSEFRGEEQTTGSGWGNSTAGKEEKQDVGIDSYLIHTSLRFITFSITLSL